MLSLVITHLNTSMDGQSCRRERLESRFLAVYDTTVETKVTSHSRYPDTLLDWLGIPTYHLLAPFQKSSMHLLYDHIISISHINFSPPTISTHQRQCLLTGGLAQSINLYVQWRQAAGHFFFSRLCSSKYERRFLDFTCCTYYTAIDT